MHPEQPNIDPRLQEVLDELARSGAAPVNTLTPVAARQQPSPETAVAAVRARHPFRHVGESFPEPVERVEHRTIPGGAGQELVLRLYTPRGRPDPGPILLYFHGGGFVIGDLDRYDATCRALANRLHLLVISVGYRQAPEHPFPAAPEDAFAAYRWTLAHAADLGGDPALVAVGGESAGGTLAAVVCLIARDRGVSLPLWQLLIYPMLDRNFDTASYRHHTGAAPLDTPTLRWYWSHYLADDADAANPYAAPLRATELHGLPPATIIGAWIDPVWSEGTFYARRLREAGVSVTYHDFPGMTHDFVGMVAVLPQARQAIGMAANDLEAALLARTAGR